MKNCLIMAIMAVASFSLSCLGADVTIVKEGDNAFRMGNGRISLLIDCNQGGAVMSYKDKLDGDVELLPDKGSARGLCIDHFQSQTWPGEMFKAKYENDEPRCDGKEAVLVLRYKTTGIWWNMSDEKVAGILLEKTYKLRSDSPVLECDIKLTSPKNDARLFAYWQQNIAYAGGTYEKGTDKTYRSSSRGVRVKDGGSWGVTGSESFIRDFTAGWIALLDTTRKSGILILSDYNELNSLYTCIGNQTFETMYRITFLPAGESVEYRTYVVPVVGLDNIVSATEDYVAGYSMKSDTNGSGELSISVIRSVNAPESLNMKVDVQNVQKPEIMVHAGDISFAAVGEKVQSKSLAFKGAGDDPLVLKVSTEAKLASGTSLAGSFEEYFNGAYKWAENIQTDMNSPVYQCERPRQKLSLKKPAKLDLIKTSFRIWYAEGLYDDLYNVAAAVHLINPSPNPNDRCDRVFVSHSSNWQTRLSSFPYDYSLLLTYRMIILGGVKKTALGDVEQEMLCDYLKAGGGMIVLGGPSAYGASNLKGTPIAELLPVEMADTPFDLEKLKNGEIKPTEEGEKFFEKDLDWSAKPSALYVHKVTVKPWGKILLEVEGRPFLVVGEVGPAKAQVFCILGAPMGELGKGCTAFWAWEDWKYLVRQLIIAR